MTTDPFLRQIRALAHEAPPVAVDHTVVLRSGRRRRLARVTGVSMVTVAVTIGLYGGVSALQPPDVAPALPSPQEPAPAPTSEPTDLPAPRAEVDAQAGTVTLPLDAWVWGPEEWATVETARALANSRCMADAGFAEYEPFEGPVPVAPDPSYGVWVRAEVEAQGYARMVPAKRSSTGLPHTAESRAASDACSRAAFQDWGWPELEQVWASAPDWGPRSAESTLATAQVREAWAVCLERNGVARPDTDDAGSHIPGGGVVRAGLEEQVRVGLIDVGCKEEVDFVQRTADLAARQQVEYMAHAGEHLERRRAAEQRVLEPARALLDEEGLLDEHGLVVGGS